MQQVVKRPDLFILRHGETVWNMSGRFQGRRDSALTEVGRRQATLQRDILAAHGVANMAVFCSPQGRARETARLVYGAGRAIQIDDRLQEIDFGEWEGLTRAEVAARTGDASAVGLWQFESPGGEDFGAISRRLISFLDDLRGPAIVVTHGTTSQVLRGLCLGLDAQKLLSLPKDHGCVYAVCDGKHTILR